MRAFKEWYVKRNIEYVNGVPISAGNLNRPCTCTVKKYSPNRKFLFPNLINSAMQDRLSKINETIKRAESRTGIGSKHWIMWRETPFLSDAAFEKMVNQTIAIRERPIKDCDVFSNMSVSGPMWEARAKELSAREAREKLFKDAELKTGIPVNVWREWAFSCDNCLTGKLFQEKVSEVAAEISLFTIDGKVVLDLVYAAFPEIVEFG